jgi:hypothetical protein
MARYFFDLLNGDGLVRDDLGVELSSRDSISKEVSRILTDIAGEEMPGQEKGAVSIEVRDEDGKAIFAGHLSFESRWLHAPNS